MRRSLSLWQLEHSGPMRTSCFLDVLIADAVPHVFVTINHMCIKYLVTLIYIKPDLQLTSSEKHFCALDNNLGNLELSDQPYSISVFYSNLQLSYLLLLKPLVAEIWSG